MTIDIPATARTVQDLINDLQKIKNKSLPVYLNLFDHTVPLRPVRFEGMVHLSRPEVQAASGWYKEIESGQSFDMDESEIPYIVICGDASKL